MKEPVELPYAKCRELLLGGVAGRAAVCTPSGPRIIPVNYSVVDEAIYVRTTPHSVLASYAAGANVAFEVDHLDYENWQGWSVVATGRAALVDAPDELARVRAFRNPRPWAGGLRQVYLRLRWTELTGRRIGDGWNRDNEMPVRRTV
jgi:nitroimidazol reductase NimA-like FMN-containing flavoprotein (pyridoxamine 5'-phosphate oxidase superfamily)